MKFKVRKIKCITRKYSNEDIYDLSVENNPSYTANGVVVHNSVCTTRLIAGVGVPQLTAIQDVVAALQDTGIPVCADGGIAKPADSNKALAAGASTVMMGQTLAFADEAAGEWVLGSSTPNSYTKFYRGSASYSVTRIHEGIKTTLNWDNNGEPPLLQEILDQYIGGLRSCMSYCDAKDLKTLQRNSRFIQLTHASHEESGVREYKPIIQRKNAII